MFPRPTKNVIFLATFHKFLQFCLSNSDVSTTFGHFSQKSPLCRCGSYTHGSQRLMVSTEFRNYQELRGAKWGGGENNLGGGAFAPLAPPWRRHCVLNIFPITGNTHSADVEDTNSNTGILEYWSNKTNTKNVFQTVQQNLC